MNNLIPMLRLTPQTAGELQGRCTKATRIGNDASKMNNDTKNALLLADLVKEAA